MCLDRRTAVPPVFPEPAPNMNFDLSALSGTRNSTDDPGGIYPTDAVVPGVGDVEVPRPVHGHAPRIVQIGLDRRGPVSPVAADKISRIAVMRSAPPAAGDGVNDPILPVPCPGCGRHFDFIRVGGKFAVVKGPHPVDVGDSGK